MKDRKLIKHFAVVGVGTIISLLLGFFNTPLLTRLVEPTSYGQFSLFRTYGGTIAAIIYLGYDQAVVRYYYDEDETTYKKELLWKSLEFPFLLLFLGYLFLFIFQSIGLLEIEGDNFFWNGLIIYVLLLLIFRFSSLLVRLNFNTKLYSLLNIMQKAVFLILSVLAILIIPANNANLLFTALMLSYFMTSLLAIYSYKDMWIPSLNRDNQNNISRKRLAKYALPLIFSSSITSLFNANDKIFLQIFSNLEEIGVYSSALSLVSLVNVVQQTFNTVWSPASIDHYNNNPEDKTFYVKGNHIITVIMVFISINLILFKDVIALILGPEYREAAFILPTLLFGPMLYTISETTVGGIVFSEKTKLHIKVAFFSFIVDIVANIIMVPILGGKGAAISTSLSYLVFFSLRTYLANREYYVDYNLKTFYILIIAVFIYALYNTFNPFNIVTVMGYLLCLILLIIFYKNTFKEIFHYIFSYIQTKI